MPAVQRRITTSVSTAKVKPRSPAIAGKENVSLNDTPLRMGTKAPRSLRRKAVLRAASTFIDEATLPKTPPALRENVTSIRSATPHAGLRGSTTNHGKDSIRTQTLSKPGVTRVMRDSKPPSNRSISRMSTPEGRSKKTTTFDDRHRPTSPTPISWSSITLPTLLSPGAESEDESMQLSPLTMTSSESIGIHFHDTSSTQSITLSRGDMKAQEIHCDISDSDSDMANLNNDMTSDESQAITGSIPDSHNEPEDVEMNVDKDDIALEMNGENEEITELPPPPPPTPSRFSRIPKFDTFSLSSALFGEFPQLDQQAVKTRYELVTLREGAGAVLQRARQFGQTIWSPSASRSTKTPVESSEPIVVASLRRSPVGIGLGRGTLRHSSSIRKMVATGKLWTSTNIETV